MIGDAAMTEASSVQKAETSAVVEFDPDLRVRKKLFQTERIVSEIVCYEGGQGTKQHVHPHQDEIFVCLEGTGMITFADDAIPDEPIDQGGMVLVPAGIRHGVATEPGQRLVLMFTKGPGLPNPQRARRGVDRPSNG